MVNDNRILATRIYSTFAFWSAIGPEAIITFLHIGSHHSVTSQAAVTYLFTMFNHVTYSPHAFHIIAVFWPSNKPASSYKKRKKKDVDEQFSILRNVGNITARSIGLLLDLFLLLLLLFIFGQGPGRRVFCFTTPYSRIYFRGACLHV